MQVKKNKYLKTHFSKEHTYMNIKEAHINGVHQENEKTSHRLEEILCKRDT